MKLYNYKGELIEQRERSCWEKEILIVDPGMRNK